MLEYWNSISTGIKVEVENSDCYDYCEEFPDSFWIATILRVTGMNKLMSGDNFKQIPDSPFAFTNIFYNFIHHYLV